MEKVQRRASKAIPELRDLPYEERIKRMKLTTLAMRRFRGDMLEVFKIYNGMEGLAFQDLFVKHNNIINTRGHDMRLNLPHTRLDIRRKYFSIRVIQAWNQLPAHVVHQPTINSFKSNIDNYIEAVLDGGATKGYPPSRS